MSFSYRIINSDFVKWARGHAWLTQNHDGLFHFLLSDWPYNLESIQKRFGSSGAAPAKAGRDGSFERQSCGFMGQQWDTSLPFQAETWQWVGELLHPGAFTASFSHPRNQDRLAFAAREAGFTINPAIYNYHSGRWVDTPAQLAWIYGMGKPNGTRLSPVIDRQAGKQGSIVGEKIVWGHNAGGNSFYSNEYRPTNGETKKVEIVAPATALAQTWDGWQYGSPLRPEVEPIIISQWPYSGRPVDSIIQTGAGAVNIAYGRAGKNGNFPGNLVLTHHPGCLRVGTKQIKNGSGSISGHEPSEGSKHVYGRNQRTPYKANKDENGYRTVPDYRCHPDCHVPKMEQQAGGDKAHYFYQADWNYESALRLAEADTTVFYSGKVGVPERNLGCADFPPKVRNRVNPGGLEHEPRLAPTLQQNNHPTLKPIGLTRWLAGLFLPPKEYAPRKCLVPCSGTGSEMIGALLAGFDEVIGIELDPEFCTIAEARVSEVAYWLKWGQDDIEAIIKAYYEKVELSRLQAGMF